MCFCVHVCVCVYMSLAKKKKERKKESKGKIVWNKTLRETLWWRRSFELFPSLQVTTQLCPLSSSAGPTHNRNCNPFSWPDSSAPQSEGERERNKSFSLSFTFYEQQSNSQINFQCNYISLTLKFAIKLSTRHFSYKNTVLLNGN